MAATRAVGTPRGSSFENGPIKDGHFLLNMEMCPLLCYLSKRNIIRTWKLLILVVEWKGPFFWKGETTPKYRKHGLQDGYRSTTYIRIIWVNYTEHQEFLHFRKKTDWGISYFTHLAKMSLCTKIRIFSYQINDAFGSVDLLRNTDKQVLQDSSFRVCLHETSKWFPRYFPIRSSDTRVFTHVNDILN